MPPVRTQPKTVVPTKTVIAPAKTERSHLENVERAYVAASRRSDRSLEARIESARRASEIHKQRTGRSLRITESAVVNEEMYDEDDDDLPSHMRRLTAHLRLSEADADLDRRLGSLLATQIGMRQALAMPTRRSSYASLQHSPHNPYPTAHSPFQQPQSPLFSTGHSYNPTGNSQYNHMRSGTMSATQQQTTNKTEPGDSSPAHQAFPLQQSPFAFHQPPTPGHEQSAFVLGSPLSATLPAASQQILSGSTFDFNDPTLGMLMSGAPDDILQPLHQTDPLDDLFQPQAGDEDLFNDMVAYGS